MLQERTIELIRQLQVKTEGLYHYSDSLFPYSISGVGENNFSLYPIMKNSKQSEFHEIEFSHFFSRLTRTHSWMTPEERTRVKRYTELLEFLVVNFENVKVIKIGSVNIDIHIIARTFHQDYIIISTAELKIPVYQNKDAWYQRFSLLISSRIFFSVRGLFTKPLML